MTKILGILLVCFFTLSGCGIYKNYSRDTNESHVPNNIEQAQSIAHSLPVNNIGNTNNGGSFFLQEDILYGRIAPATDGFGFFNLSRQSVGNKDVHVIVSGYDVSNVVVYGQYIYYRNTPIVLPYFQSDYFNKGIGAAYRVNISTEEVSQLTEELVSAFYIYENKIFYQVGTYEVAGDGISYNKKTQIFSAELDGGDKQLEYTYNNGENPVSGLFSIYEGKIFLVTESGPVTVSLETEEVTDYSEMLNEQAGEICSVSKLVPIHDDMYILAQQTINAFSKPRAIYKINMSTNKVTQISASPTYDFTSDESYLYICDATGLKQCSLEGELIKTITSNVEFYSSPQIVGTDIYFLDEHNRGGTTIFYKVSTLTGEQERIG